MKNKRNANDIDLCGEPAKFMLVLHSNIFANLKEIEGHCVPICAKHKAFIEKHDEIKENEYMRIKPISQRAEAIQEISATEPKPETEAEKEHRIEAECEIDARLDEEERQYNEDADNFEEMRETGV